LKNNYGDVLQNDKGNEILGIILKIKINISKQEMRTALVVFALFAVASAFDVSKFAALI
jgi:hypothetical protein